jgi:fatty acid desaturase
MTQTASLYEQARIRAVRKRKFRGDLVGYLVVNAFLVGIWAVTGFGYFWPAWVLAVWGVFLVLGAWEGLYRRDVTEEDIQREMHRLS